MRYLTFGEALKIGGGVMEQFDAPLYLRDAELLDSSLKQPQMTFGGEDLYPEVVDKAAILGYSVIRNHPFVDGNKRIGHALMEMFLLLNGYEVGAGVDEQERVIFEVARGAFAQEEFRDWLNLHLADTGATRGND